MGFLLAAAVAIPLGIWHGHLPAGQALLLAPSLDPLRFLPISALVPLFIVWFGIDEHAEDRVPVRGHDRLPAAAGGGGGGGRGRRLPADRDHASGASRRASSCGTCWSRAACPPSARPLRVMNGIGWTYVILAEVDQRAAAAWAHSSPWRASAATWTRSSRCVLVILLIGVATDLDDPRRQQAAVRLEARVMATADEPVPTSCELRDVSKTLRHARTARPSRPSATSTSSSRDEPDAGEFRVFLGPSGLRQEHDPQHRGRPLSARPRGEALLRGEPINGPGPDRGHGLPELQLVPVADRARQRARSA